LELGTVNLNVVDNEKLLSVWSDKTCCMCDLYWMCRSTLLL